MIERDRRTDVFTVSCDEHQCFESVEIDTEGQWQEMIEQIKRDGWLTFHDGRVWRHVCPACKAKRPKEGRGF